MINNPYKDYLVYKDAFDTKKLELNKANQERAFERTQKGKQGIIK